MRTLNDRIRMDLQKLQQTENFEWRVEPHGDMRVPAILYGDRALMEEMDDKVYEQLCNVTMLPGIVGAGYAMPDAHWGYGFPIGGVPRSIRKTTVSYRPAVSALTSPAAFARS